MGSGRMVGGGVMISTCSEGRETKRVETKAQLLLFPCPPAHLKHLWWRRLCNLEKVKQWFILNMYTLGDHGKHRCDPIVNNTTSEVSAEVTGTRGKKARLCLKTLA